MSLRIGAVSFAESIGGPLVVSETVQLRRASIWSITILTRSYPLRSAVSRWSSLTNGCRSIVSHD